MKTVNDDELALALACHRLDWVEGEIERDVSNGRKMKVKERGRMFLHEGGR